MNNQNLEQWKITPQAILLFFLGVLHTVVMTMLMKQSGFEEWRQEIYQEEFDTLFIIVAHCCGLFLVPLIPILGTFLPIFYLSVDQKYKHWSDDPKVIRYMTYSSFLVRKLIRGLFFVTLGMLFASLWSFWELWLSSGFLSVSCLLMFQSLSWFNRKYQIPHVEKPPFPGKRPDWMWIFSGAKLNEEEEPRDEEDTGKSGLKEE